jgi:hypothetical protein
MKCLLCARCVDIRALDPHGRWTTCRCGACSARWEDPDRGTVRVKADSQGAPRILGLNNTFLLGGMLSNQHDDSCEMGGSNAAWRKRHDEATHAPGYVFDKAFRACWAAILRVGDTADIKWEEGHEWPRPEPPDAMDKI